MRLTCALACVLAAAPFAPSSVYGQSSNFRPAIGIWAGVTSATFRGSDAPGPTNLTGFSAGLFTQWRLAPHLLLQPEVQYTQKGSDEADVTGDGTFYTMHIRLTYIEVPLLLRVEGSRIGPFTPFAVIGPEIAFKAGCGLVLNGLNGSYSCASLPTAKPVDYGGIAGAGVAFKIAGRTYGLSARYDAGIADTFERNNARNRAWTLLLGTLLK